MNQLIETLKKTIIATLAILFFGTTVIHAIYDTHTIYVWETPFIGWELQERFYGKPNYPAWVPHYTSEPEILYNIGSVWNWGLRPFKLFQ